MDNDNEFGSGGPGRHHEHHPTYHEIELLAYADFEKRIAAGGDFFGEADLDWNHAERKLDHQDHDPKPIF